MELQGIYSPWHIASSVRGSEGCTESSDPRMEGRHSMVPIPDAMKSFLLYSLAIIGGLAVSLILTAFAMYVTNEHKEIPVEIYSTSYLP